MLYPDFQCPKFPFFFIILKKTPIYPKTIDLNFQHEDRDKSSSQEIKTPLLSFSSPYFLSYSADLFPSVYLAGYNIRAFFIYHDIGPSINTGVVTGGIQKRGGSSYPMNEVNHPSLRLTLSLFRFD